MSNMGMEVALAGKDIDTSLFVNQLHLMKQRMDEMSHGDNKPSIKFSAGYVYGVAEVADDLRSMFEKADELGVTILRKTAAKEFIMDVKDTLTAIFLLGICLHYRLFCFGNLALKIILRNI